MSPLVNSVRYSALTEGISYLILVFIAMPLKYGLDLPQAVSVFGMIHGLLFILVCGLLAWAWWKKEMSFTLCVQVFIASLIPFGAFWADLKIRECKVKA
jgi:integral membrane protein